jgi:hypothetical protein
MDAFMADQMGFLNKGSMTCATFMRTNSHMRSEMGGQLTFLWGGVVTAGNMATKEIARANGVVLFFSNFFIQVIY